MNHSDSRKFAYLARLSHSARWPWVLSQIIVEELEGIDNYEAIVDRINHRIVEAIVTAGTTSAT
jgi:hypothetical protein